MSIDFGGTGSSYMAKPLYVKIFDEALDLIDSRINELRVSKAYQGGTMTHVIQMKNLKEIRDILKQVENFRDDE
jgi:hypothetical protein